MRFCVLVVSFEDDSPIPNVAHSRQRYNYSERSPPSTTVDD